MKFLSPIGIAALALLAATSAAATSAAATSAAATSAAATAYHITDQIKGPDGGWDYVRVDDKTGQVLVTRGGAVMAVDIAAGKINPSFAIGSRMHIAMPVGDGSELLLTNGGTDTAVFVDAATGAGIASVPTGKGPDAAAYDPAHGLVLAIDHSGGDVVLIDARSHRKLATIAVGGELEEAAVDGKGRAFINVESENQIAVLDLKARKVAARYSLPGCAGPTGLAYDARSGLLIAACDGSTALVKASTGKLIRTLPTGRGADGVALDARRRLAFIPAGEDGTLSVISLADGRGRIVQTLATRRSARTIGIDEATGRLYLPSADYLPAAQPGGRRQVAPGSFRLLVVSP